MFIQKIERGRLENLRLVQDDKNLVLDSVVLYFIFRYYVEDILLDTLQDKDTIEDIQDILLYFALFIIFAVVFGVNSVTVKTS